MSCILSVLASCTVVPEAPSNKKAEFNSEKLALPQANLTKAANINLQLALDYLKENHLPLAHKKLLLAEQQAPKLSRVYTLKGYYFALVGQMDEANLSYLKALKLSKNSPEIQNSYGVFLCRAGKYQQGITLMRQAIANSQFTKTGLAYQNIGLCAMSMKENSQALSSFEKAITYNPNLASSVYYLAYMNFKLKHYQLANANLQQFLKLSGPTKQADDLKAMITKETIST